MSYTIKTATGDSLPPQNLFIGYAENKTLCFLNAEGQVSPMPFEEQDGDIYSVPGQQDKLCAIYENGCSATGDDKLRNLLGQLKVPSKDGKSLSEADIFTYNGGETLNPHFMKVATVSFGLEG